MEHHFNTTLAKEYGIETAVIIQNLYYWIYKNAANEKNLREGRFWTYNSINAFAILFEYLSKHQIQRVLKKLKDLDIILAKNFNENPYDKTLWYAFSDNGLSILQNCGFDVVKLHHREKETATSNIYNIYNTNNKPYNKQNNTTQEQGTECQHSYDDDGLFGEETNSDSNVNLSSATNVSENGEPTEWKQSFDVYLSLVKEAEEKLIRDDKFRETKLSFLPNVNYVKTIQYSVASYWGTEAAWEYCKKKKTKTINLLTALKNAYDRHKIYLQKGEVNTVVYESMEQSQHNNMDKFIDNNGQKIYQS